MKIVFILLILVYITAESHPYKVGDVLVTPPYLTLSVNKSNTYILQMDINIEPLNGRGFYKNIKSSAFNFDYGLRINKNNKADHRFRFLLYDQQGLFYNTLLSYATSSQDPESGEYLFHHYGFKLLEWSNTENFTEFNICQVSTELTLENRTNHKPMVYGLPYSPNTHNFYFIPRLTFEISQINLRNNLFGLPSNITDESFWDIPTGVYFEVGYDWINEKEIKYKTKIGEETAYKKYTNSISLSCNYKLYPFRNCRVLTYGVKLNIDTGINFLNFIASFKRNEINIDKFKNYNYNLSIEYPFLLDF